VYKRCKLYYQCNHHTQYHIKCIYQYLYKMLLDNYYHKHLDVEKKMAYKQYKLNYQYIICNHYYMEYKHFHYNIIHQDNLLNIHLVLLHNQSHKLSNYLLQYRLYNVILRI